MGCGNGIPKQSRVNRRGVKIQNWSICKIKDFLQLFMGLARVVQDCDILSAAWVVALPIMPYLLFTFSNEIMIKFISVAHISISHHLY
jgi:hypothetical protein